MTDISLSIPPQEASYCYWPGEVGAAGMYGKLSVELKAVTSHGDTVLRRMEVAEKKLKDGQAEPTKTLPVTQLQLLSWAEQGLPHPMAILSLIDHLTSAQMSSSTKHTVVMCRSACIVYIRYTYIHIGYCVGGKVLQDTPQAAYYTAQGWCRKQWRGYPVLPLLPMQ